MLDSLIVQFDLKNHTYQIIPLEQFSANWDQPDKVYWIHCNLNQKDIFNTLAQKLHLAEPVIKLCKEKDTLPVLIETDDTATLQTQCIRSFDPKTNKIHFSRLVIHLTGHYCLTASSNSVPVLNEFSEHFKNALQFAKTSCFILFLILDSVVNDYAKIIFNFEIEVEQMDFEIHASHKDLYTQLIAEKIQIMKLKRNIYGLRELLMRLSVRKISVISDACRTSLNNLINHTQMIVNEIGSVRDLLNSLLHQIDNALMQKMNSTMKVLTGFAAIFLPLTLITGIYGMNFAWMPELTWRYGYFWALGLILGCGLVMVWVFKKMDWF